MKVLILFIFSMVVLSLSFTQTKAQPPILENKPSLQTQVVPPPRVSTPPQPPNATAAPPQPPQQGVPQPPPPGSKAIQPLQPPTAPPLQLINTAQRAVETAREVIPLLKVGKVWQDVTPDGKSIIKVALMYEGRVIALLNLDTTGNNILPLGFNPPQQTSSNKVDLRQAMENVKKAIKELTALKGAEYIEPERAWVIPIAYRDSIVTHIKVYQDGIHVIPDYPAEVEVKRLQLSNPSSNMGSKKTRFPNHNS